MVAVPPAILEMLHLSAGATVGMSVEAGRLVIEAATRRRYTLDELLAATDLDAPRRDEDRAWLELPSAGREI